MFVSLSTSLSLSLSLTLSLSLLQFCLYRSSLIESCSKSYKEQSQIPPKHVQPERFVTLSSLSEFVSISLSLSLTTHIYICIYIYKFVSICLVKSKRAQPEMFVSLSTSLSLSLSLYLSLTHSISLSLYFSSNFVSICLIESVTVQQRAVASKFFCANLIESSRKQILLRKSYREQLRILSRAAANPV